MGPIDSIQFVKETNYIFPAYLDGATLYTLKQSFIRKIHNVCINWAILQEINKNFTTIYYVWTRSSKIHGSRTASVNLGVHSLE